MQRLPSGPEDLGYLDYRSKSYIVYGRNVLRGGIVRAGKNLITIAIKGLPISLLPVNHTDSDVGHLKHCVQVCQSAGLLFI